MKIRNGFVSNSSSSSFVVLIPNGFKITDLVKDEGEDYTYGEDLELPYSEYCEKLQKMVDDGGAYQDDELYGELEEIFYCTDYVLESIDVDSSSGGMTFIKEDKILEKLKLIKNVRN